MQGNSFTLDPEVKTSPLLSDSWFRSQQYGLDPATDDFPRLGSGELADALASHARARGTLVIVLLEAECERAMVRTRLPDEVVLLGPGGNPSEQAARLRACLDEWRSRAGAAAAMLDGHH